MNLMQAVSQLEQAVGLPLNQIKESLEK